MFDRLVTFSARLSPDAIAISNGVNHVSYGDLDRLVRRVAGRLQSAKLSTGRLVAIDVTDQYHHLLLILACARLGVPTVSVDRSLARVCAEVAHASLLVGDNPEHGPDLLIDQQWLRGALSATDELSSASYPADAIGRVQLTSGTTGKPKAVAMSWELFDRRVQRTWMRHAGYERLLSLVGLESGSLPLLIWTLARGGTVLFGSADFRVLARSLPALAPTGLLASPSQLASLLGALQRRATPLPGLQIGIIGARAPQKLSQQAALRLGTVDIAYASTEAGVCTLGLAAHLAEPASVGWVTPWTFLEIVDELGQAVPCGQQGRVRISGPEVITTYVGADQEAAFDKRWFYPGDIGILSKDGQLSIVGREDDLLNLGGEKVLPAAFEEPAMTVEGVTQAAAFALEDSIGVPGVWIALVRNGDVDETALARSLAGIPHFPINLLYVDGLPVTPMGKVQRDILREWARRDMSSGRIRTLASSGTERRGEGIAAG